MGLSSRGLELFAYSYPEVSTGCQASVFISQCHNFLSSVMESLYQFWEPMNLIYLSILSKLNYQAVAVGQVYHHAQETKRNKSSQFGKQDGSNKQIVPETYDCHSLFLLNRNCTFTINLRPIICY